MFIVEDQKQTIINIDHAESIYTEDEQYLHIRTDYYTYSKFYGDKTKAVLRMIMEKIYQGVNVIYLPTNDELEDHHEDADSIVPDCCYFCATYDGNSSFQGVKINYCPVCGRKLGD